MACDPNVFQEIPVFSLLDADERVVLAEQVELRRFAPRQRIYKVGDPGGKAYVVLKGQVQVVVIDEDHQEVVIDSPGPGEIFGLASLLAAVPHQTTAVALEDTSTIEIERADIGALLQRKPMAGLDILTMVSRHFHAAQGLIRVRAARNPNEVIEERLTMGDRIADLVDPLTRCKATELDLLGEHHALVRVEQGEDGNLLEHVRIARHGMGHLRWFGVSDVTVPTSVSS